MTRVHFETSPKARESQQLSGAELTAILGAIPGLTDRVRLSFNSDPARTDGFLAEAEVLHIAGPVDLSNLAARAPALKWVQMASAGVERAVPHIPAGVQISNVRGVHSARAGEFGMTALLMLNNHIPIYATQQRAREWRQIPAASIAGKTVAIMGLGALGGACAEWAKRLGMHVIGISRSGAPHAHADEVVTLGEVKGAFARSDFVVITLPLTDETRGCVGRAELDCLPPHAGLINIGRAPVLDTGALIAKLSDGTLSGAVLDVFDQEPLPAESGVWDVPNLFVTPHSGLDDPGSFGVRCVEVFARNLAEYVAGRPILTPVDTALGY